MAAMTCAAVVRWNAGVVVASVLIAILAATAAMTIFFQFSKQWGQRFWIEIGAALIMGAGVCGMH
jgi:NO-binding membrane sensor protein with MHYT domain